jgi:hypothetical protein
MKYIIALISILLIFYLHGRMAYESLDTSFSRKGRMVVDVTVGNEKVSFEGFNNNIPERCKNWRHPQLVPDGNANVDETEEWKGEEGFVSNFFNEKIKKFRSMFSKSGGEESFDISNKYKNSEKTHKTQINKVLKKDETFLDNKNIEKIVPAINATPQKILDNTVLVASDKDNLFKMDLVKPEGKMGFYEECPDGWYHNNIKFTATGDRIDIKECKKSKNSNADAFATLKSGKVNAIHIRRKGKYFGVPKVEINSVDGKGRGAKGKVYLDKNGGVSRVEITDKGTGYESLPDIVFIETKKKCKLCIKPNVVMK